VLGTRHVSFRPDFFLPSLIIPAEWGRLPSVMGQSAYPSHTGLVARPEDRLSFCATAGGILGRFLQIFSRFFVALSTTSISNIS